MLKKMFNPPSEPTYSPLDDEHIVDFQRRQIRRWRLRFFYLSGFYIFALLVALGILLKQALYRAETLFPDCRFISRSRKIPDDVPQLIVITIANLN